MDNLYKVGIRCTKELEDGTFKRVTEHFLIEAISFTDAEFRANEEEELRALILKSGEVVSMERKTFSTITEGLPEQVFFEVKTEVIEDGAKIQKGVQLIRGYGMEEALEEIAAELREEYKSSKIVSAKESGYLGYFPKVGTEVRKNLALKVALVGEMLEGKVGLLNAGAYSVERKEGDGFLDLMKDQEDQPAPEAPAEETEDKPASRPASRRTTKPAAKAEKKPAAKKAQRTTK